ncbi:hypothetical protein E3N88_04222 [Mikania micrantha]|uniref:ribulose-bisphosphate carboxylase n=1 Tax=Mikania micrantha TaxID=192012 RepID=A0A5N6PTS6_9ASTR|nr:hypothetical protein E3N88_04222 [Mikania micrantha]
MYSLTAYAFIAQDFTTQAALYTHHQYIAGFIMTGAFAHWAIFFIRDYNPEQNEDNVLARMLEHKEAIISHLSWASLFLGFHTLGLYVHNDVMLAFGTPEKQILIEPIFAQWIQSAHGKTSYGFDILLSSTNGPAFNAGRSIWLPGWLNVVNENSSRFDFDRYGLVPRSSPRQGDLILTAGTLTMKMAPSLVRLYEQMPEPKYVIAMGACTITGGMFSTDSYSTVRGVDKLIPVDVYLPGCPPKPEAIIDAITKLRKKISREIYPDRMMSQRENRCFTTNHKFQVGHSIHTGNYDQGFLYQPPSTSEIPPETFFKYKSSVSSHELPVLPVAGLALEFEFQLALRERRACYECLRGGLDFTKDDENVNSQPFIRWRDGFVFCAEAIYKAQAETGEIKGHYLNATAGNCDEMMKRAAFARELGVPIVMHDYLTGGLTANTTLAHYCRDNGLLLHIHRAMHAVIDRQKNHGMHFRVRAKALRMSGGDHIHSGTVVGKFEGEREITLGFVDLLRDDFIEKDRSRRIYFTQDWVSLPGVLPVASGGFHVWHMQDN